MAIDFSKIASAVAQGVAALAPIALNFATGDAIPTITMVGKIVQGVVEGSEQAIALYNTIQSGDTPTPAELESYLSDYDKAHDQLNTDITEAEKTAT